MTDRQPQSPPASLISVLAFTLCASLSNGGIAHGIYFISTHEHGFSDRENLALALGVYTPYIAAALLSGRVSRLLGARLALNLAVGCMIVCLYLLSLGPSVVWFCILVSLFNTLAGFQWPVVESYLASGRYGKTLRRTLGIWNLTWAIAIIVSLWTIGYLIENPSTLFIVLAVVHGCGLLLTLNWKRNPHSPDVIRAEDTHDPEYVQLLGACQIFLPVGYVLMYSLTPLLPGVFQRLNVEPGDDALWSSTYLISRLLPFTLMFLIPRWHGKWSVPLWSAILMAGGFGVALIAPTILIVVLGLACFGIGQGMIYYSAIYYRMSVGHAKVESGGTHEAVIGLGYSTGPAISLAAMSIHNSAVSVLVAIGAIYLIASGISVRSYRVAMMCRRDRQDKG